VKFTVLCCMLCVSCFLQVAVKRLRVLDLDKVGAPNEQYGAGGSSDSAQSSGDVDGSQRAMGASQAAFRQFFEREIAILASIRHPNVVNFIGELGVFESVWLMWMREEVSVNKCFIVVHPSLWHELFCSHACLSISLAADGS
jgi:hypothetical protein